MRAPKFQRSVARLIAAAIAGQIPGFGLIRVVYDEAKDRVTKDYRAEIETLKREKEIADRLVVTMLAQIERLEADNEALIDRLMEEASPSNPPASP